MTKCDTVTKQVPSQVSRKVARRVCAGSSGEDHWTLASKVVIVCSGSVGGSVVGGSTGGAVGGSGGAGAGLNANFGVNAGLNFGVNKRLGANGRAALENEDIEYYDDERLN